MSMAMRNPGTTNLPLKTAAALLLACMLAGCSILGENRAAINSFANDGLSQLGPTLGELRSLVRDLRRISDHLEGGPARYILGRDAPKEFEPK